MTAAPRRLTGELADWYGHDAGYLPQGRYADVAVIDPAHVEGSSAAYSEAPYPGAADVKRMADRNDGFLAASASGSEIVY